MYLKALEIQGFKSFPDRTVLHFGEDITAIVGPNGSGKSNISDAIRWVMGEQSAKGLRGDRMEDVIFGGTEKRAQVGFAQVSLVIDNTGHVFPDMEESEVAVTRRYYRSGESEYYINRQSVRLRDVTELFLDTGMGREGYSIIGQGRIDEILSARSGERREVFEEAAGISRFRRRKEEAQRKLTRTEENLLRINDKIDELSMQVEPLREQAEKAKHYLILRDELRLLELSLWLERLDRLRADGRKLDMDLRCARADRDRAQKALDDLYAQGEAVSQQMQEKDLAAEQEREALARLDGEKREQESAIAVLENGIANHEENIRRAEEELAESDDRAGGLLRQAETQEARIRAIDGQTAELHAALDVLLEEARTAADAAGGAQSKADALRACETAAMAVAADARAEAAAIGAENAQLMDRLTGTEQDCLAAGEKLAETEQTVKQNRRALEDAQEEAGCAANIIAGHGLRLAEREKRAAAAAEERVRLTMDAGALENRIRLLAEMEREYEGFSKAVRLVMQADSLRGIHGPAAGLLRTEKAHSLAIETALGGGLQNIVVDREEDAKAAISFLKRRDGGRATFLPLTAIHGEELRERGIEEEMGFVGIASRLIRFDPQYQGVFRSLLGRTVVVEDMDCGIAMARRHRHAFRIVTLDGQVINRGGSMTGGSTSRSAGVLSRKAELTALRDRSGRMEEQLQSARQAEEIAQRELAAERYAMQGAQLQQRQAEDEVLRLEGEAGRLTSLRDTLKERISALETEQKALADRIAENRDRARAAECRITEQEALALDYRAQVGDALAGQTEQLARSGELAERIGQQRSALAALAAEREATARSAGDLRRLCRDLDGGREQKERALEGYRRSIAQAQAEIGRCRERIGDLTVRTDACRERLSALQQEKLALEAKRTARNRESQSMNEDLLRFERAAALLEQKRSAADMEARQILDKLWEHYGLSHSDAQAQRIELESVARAGRRIGELKRAISALGTPNIGAIEEFERVNTRYTYLTGQRDDVDRAKAELTGVIRELTDRMTDIFAQQFKLLSERFQTTFTELFGGGTARLELEDPDNILDCGIDIKAQPPGKALKTISLLSGGEKAFVAIALYFAILQVHPTPFCVMDEIEAALDDVNVTRYARYMRTLADKTQFIVITHRRGTMEEADVLYGVTMQERGVSKMLTINLNDMAKELKID